MTSRLTVSLLAIAAAALAGYAGAQLARLPEAPHDATVSWRELEPDDTSRPATAGEVDDLRRIVAQVRRGAPEGIAALELPAQPVELLGETVPLDDPEIHDAVLYELMLTVGKPLMPMLWLRRAPTTLPMIEERLREAGLPDDLKFVAMIESDLRWQVTSPAGAEGLWQFVRGTARRYGLTVNRYLDERRDPERATEAAIAYLSELHDEFGSWFLALAAYNAGENRIREALEQQGPRGYFDLYLPRETRRYVPRLLAAKLVFSEPERFGLARAQPRWVPRYRHVEVDVRRSRVSLIELAREHDLDYRDLRLANPQIRREFLPRGRHRLRVPESGPPPSDVARNRVPGVVARRAARDPVPAAIVTDPARQSDSDRPIPTQRESMP
ncbi:MAG: lytic transglycosylase [Acidobacteria bacterium]|nr:MAG: lytic transglycosylase [Acidobacteriota bacterium]